MDFGVWHMASASTRPRTRAQIPHHIALVAHGLFQSQGYAQVTMEHIASQAAVSKRTLYKYYPVKEALLARVLEQALAKDLQDHAFPPGPNAGFTAAARSLLQACARWCEQHPDYLLPYVRYKFATFDPSTTSGDEPGLLPLWTRLIAAGQARAELRADCPAEQLGFYFHYLYLGALMRWLTTPRLELQHEFDTVLEIFGQGVRLSSGSIAPAV